VSTRHYFASLETEGQKEDKRLVFRPLNDLTGSELSIYRWLLWRYNEKSGQCNPGEIDIAVGVGLTDRTVRTVLGQLREKKLVTWKRVRSKDGKHERNWYSLVLPPLPEDSSAGVDEPTEESSEATGNFPSSPPEVPPADSSGEQDVTGHRSKKEKKSPPLTPPEGNEYDRKTITVDVSQPSSPKPPVSIETATASTAKQQQVEEREAREQLAALRSQLPTLRGNFLAATERSIKQLEADLAEPVSEISDTARAAA
jgi:hypothetical protein